MSGVKFKSRAWPVKAGKDRDMDFSSGLQKEGGPANYLLLER